MFEPNTNAGLRFFIPEGGRLRYDSHSRHLGISTFSPGGHLARCACMRFWEVTGVVLLMFVLISTRYSFSFTKSLLTRGVFLVSRVGACACDACVVTTRGRLGVCAGLLVRNL